MFKHIPYAQYDVAALEVWVNEQAAQGYKLVRFRGSRAEFRENPGPRKYYRARFSADGSHSEGAVAWGGLYFYQADSPDKLPKQKHAADAKAIAEQLARPKMAEIMLLLLVGVMVLEMLLMGYWFVAFAAALTFLSLAYDQFTLHHRASLIARSKPVSAPKPKIWWLDRACMALVVAALLLEMLVR